MTMCLFWRNLVFLLASIVITEAVPGCRDGWVRNKGSCYLIAQQPFSWAESEAVCLAAFSTLVEIETKEESDFLETELRKRHGNTSTLANSYWIGGNDITIEGDYRWFRNDAALTYTDWNPGQPDDGGNIEDCMELQGIFSYHWNDHNCDNKQHFICEAEATAVDPEIIG